MYIHFTKLNREKNINDTRNIGGASSLILGQRDRFDDDNNYAGTEWDAIITTGFSLSNYEKLSDRLYKSWEMRHLHFGGELYFVERLFVRMDDRSYIPYRLRITANHGGCRTYVLYRNIEEIRRVLLGGEHYCFDPRITAVDHYHDQMDDRTWVPFIDFAEFLRSDTLITNNIGYRAVDRPEIERSIDQVIQSTYTQNYDTSINRFTQCRDLLIPDREALPMAFLSEDVMHHTAMEIYDRRFSTQFYWDEVEQIDWRSLPNVISPELDFRKTISTMEDFIYTDVNVDIEVDSRDRIMGIYPAIVIDRYRDLRKRPVLETTEDDYTSLIRNFVDDVTRWAYHGGDDVLLEHLSKSFLVKFIKTPIEEGVLLIYPYGSQYSSDPLFGIYVDFAMEALCDLNANWQ